MTINPNLGYQLGPGASYEALRAYQHYLEQEALRRYGPPIFYEPYLPPQPARTNMKEWVANLQDDFDRNQRRIEQLAKIDTLGPTPRQDIELMTTELHLRRTLSEVLKQRMNTEAAKRSR